MTKCTRQRIRIFLVDHEGKGIIDQSKNMYKERDMIYSGPVAPMWLKPKTLANLQEISKHLWSFGLFIYLQAFLFFLIFISKFYSWQVEIEQKKSLKPDFEGDEMDNPKECGVQ